MRTHEIKAHGNEWFDVLLLGTGNTRHYVEVRSIDDGSLVLRKAFQGDRAFKRALSFWAEQVESVTARKASEILDSHYASRRAA